MVEIVYSLAYIALSANLLYIRAISTMKQATTCMAADNRFDQSGELYEIKMDGYEIKDCNQQIDVSHMKGCDYFDQKQTSRTNWLSWAFVYEREIKQSDHQSSLVTVGYNLWN